jgi:hypothetical protein
LDKVNHAKKVLAWSSGLFDPINSGLVGPENAVDGNPNTRWAGHPPNTAWIALDLGAVREISKVRVRFERAYADEYAVKERTYEGSLLKFLIADDDGKHSQNPESHGHLHWKRASFQTKGKEGWNEFSLEPAVHARYVKLAEIKPAVDGWGMSIWEWEVLGRREQI